VVIKIDALEKRARMRKLEGEIDKHVADAKKNNALAKEKKAILKNLKLEIKGAK